jgi:catechol 2,3-dioxygenase
MATTDFFRSVQLDRVTLRVGDSDRVGEFYQRALGLSATATAPGRTTLSSGPDEPALLELEESASAPMRPPGAAGLFHVALLFPTRESLGCMLSHLSDAGVRLGSADHGVSEVLYLADPEGNGLELYVDRPADAWPPPEPDGQVAMFTDPLDLRSLMAAGEGQKSPPLPTGLRIGHVHLSVSSLERAEAFYGNELGFAVRQRSYPGALFLARDGYHHHLGMNTWRSRAAAVPGSRGLARFSLRLTDPEELARVLTAARDRVVGPGPQGGTLLRDFDGLEIELLESSRDQRR